MKGAISLLSRLRFKSLFYTMLMVLRKIKPGALLFPRFRI